MTPQAATVGTKLLAAIYPRDFDEEVRIVRTDRGSTFLSAATLDWLHGKSIHLEATGAEDHHQVGAVERRIGDLKEHALAACEALVLFEEFNESHAGIHMGRGRTEPAAPRQSAPPSSVELAAGRPRRAAGAAASCPPAGRRLRPPSPSPPALRTRAFRVGARHVAPRVPHG